MADVTISELADVVGVSVDKLLSQIKEAGLPHTKPDETISNEDKTVTVVFNGEIYNYRELTATLRAQQHTFATASDTETIVHLYEEHGFDCVAHLRGMFAFAVWDRRTRTLLLARDRLGIKPLYYATHAGRLLFASELKALLADRTLPRQLDPHGLAA